MNITMFERSSLYLAHVRRLRNDACPLFHWMISVITVSFIMEFGRISLEELDSINVELPADHPETRSHLNGIRQSSPQIFVGCAKWGRKDWIGTVYPPKTKESEFLSHYASHFNSIELNATFYKIPSRRQTQIWSEKVGSDFIFCPKFSQSITHIRRLKNAKEATDRFLDGVSGFGRNLGPLFLMPHPAMSPKNLETLQLFFEELPTDFQVFMELRHPDWFADAGASDAIAGILRPRTAGLIITDAAGRRDCLHMRLTSPEVFIRFVGNGLHPTDYKRIDAWVERIGQWIESGIEKVYFFMHQQEELHSPVLCKYFIEKINARCNVSLTVPAFQSENIGG